MRTEPFLTVYHTGFARIPEPDLSIGKKNADFGQGFYLSDDEDFAVRWAKTRKGADCVLNTYHLSLEGLRVRQLRQDEAWYDYIFANRAGYPDTLADCDLVIGPIACDTIYDTWGILTSGVVDRDLALKAYRLGPPYRQIVLKSENALRALRFVGSRLIAPDEIAGHRTAVRQEEEAFFGKALPAAEPRHRPGRLTRSPCGRSRLCRLLRPFDRVFLQNMICVVDSIVYFI